VEHERALRCRGDQEEGQEPAQVNESDYTKVVRALEVEKTRFTQICNWLKVRLARLWLCWWHASCCVSAL
jgi:hypothetical protein